ncbi:MAG: HlyD family type I secretion periplasmic adaptor subunit [Dongiaceae bacterium]
MNQLTKPAAGKVPRIIDLAADESLPALPIRLRTTTRGPILAGLLIVAIAFGGFGAWAALSPLDSAAIAPGVVIVDSRHKVIQHLEGGIIREIMVRDGARVEAGQLLIRLEGAQARITHDLLRGQYLSMLALEARLLAERDGESSVTYPAEVLAERDDPEVVKIIAGQDNQFAAGAQYRAGEVAILRQRIAQLEEEIKGLEAQQSSKKKQAGLIREELKGVKELYEKGLEKKPRMLALQRAAALLDGDRAQIEAQVSRAMQQIGETQLRIIDVENQFQQTVAQDLRDTQSRLAEISDKLRAAADVLRRLDIVAPEAGVVTNLRFQTVGGVIPNGQPIMEIVPSDEKLVIEARIRPDDIDVVHVGMKAEVRLTAFKRRYTPTMFGRITLISPDRIMDEKLGVPYFLARIEVDPSTGKDLEDVSLYPGMQAEVMIATGQRLAIDYLLGPIAESVNRAFREE